MEFTPKSYKVKKLCKPNALIYDLKNYTTELHFIKMKYPHLFKKFLDNI